MKHSLNNYFYLIGQHNIVVDYMPKYQKLFNLN